MNTFDDPPDHDAAAAASTARNRGRAAVDEDIARAFDDWSAARGAVADARRRLAADRRIRTALRDDAGGLGRDHGKSTARDDRDREQQRQCSHDEHHRFVGRMFR